MTNEEIAAFVLVVHVRNVALEKVPDEAVDLNDCLSDNLPVKEWQELYAVALKNAERFNEDAYSASVLRVHKVQPHIASAAL